MSPTSTTGDDADRRGSKRHLYRSTAVCRFAGPEDEPFFGQVVNVSTSGVQILIRRGLSPGARFNLNIINARKETVADVEAIVRWLRPEGPDASRVGLELDRPLTFHEIASIC